VEQNRDFSSPYLRKTEGGKAAWVVIAGDRGLAGGYNSNVLKLAWSKMEGTDCTVIPMGKKAVDFFRSRKTPALIPDYAEAEDISIGDCFTVAKQLCKAYRRGEFTELHIVYTNFVSVLSQEPEIRQMLPLVREQAAASAPRQEILYEPDSTAVFDAIVPEYLGGMIYGALCESRAAEQAARRTAMDSATQNAEEMIADLSLKFNQARQAAITQEITEIVAGS
jgi:F-type H+-transporting ATPase subunit gamma